MHVAETRDEVRLFQRKEAGWKRLYAAAGMGQDPGAKGAVIVRTLAP